MSLQLQARRPRRRNKSTTSLMCHPNEQLAVAFALSRILHNFGRRLFEARQSQTDYFDVDTYIMKADGRLHIGVSSHLCINEHMFEMARQELLDFF